MQFALAPGISFCDAGGCRIFLSLSRDQYFCLDEAADRAFSTLVTGAALDETSRRALERLVVGGILVAGLDTGPPTPCPVMPFREAPLDRDGPKVGAGRSVAAACGVALAKFDLRWRSLEQNCAGFVAQKAASANLKRVSRPMELAELAFAYQASGRFVGALDQCLALSLAIATASLQRGFGVHVLFGVKLRPFQAHAWAIADGTLISDRSDIVRPFTPILVL